MSWVFSGFYLRESSQNVAFSKVLCLNLLNFTLKFTNEIVKNLKGQQ